MVKVLGSMEEFNSMVELSKTKLIVIDFYATWCGPCRMIEGTYAQFATDYPEAEFVKVDVDESDDIAAACGIQAMPTFQFYKGGEKAAEVRGADVAKLKTLIAEHK